MAKSRIQFSEIVGLPVTDLGHVCKEINRWRDTQVILRQGRMERAQYQQQYKDKRRRK